MNFPLNDDAFEEVSIAKVQANEKGGGWQIERSDGWNFWIPKDSPIAPAVGMSARFYGKGIGFNVRGLFLDGAKVFYRTDAEDAEYQEEQRYGKDAAEWLARWDSGAGCWSVEMGGFGPGYEQALQITVAENLRHLLSVKPPRPCPEDQLKAVHEAMEQASFENEVIKKLGLSGAQFGAAGYLAWQLYQRGPIDVMRDPKLQDRHIQISKFFPDAYGVQTPAHTWAEAHRLIDRAISLAYHDNGGDAGCLPETSNARIEALDYVKAALGVPVAGKTVDGGT